MKLQSALPLLLCLGCSPTGKTDTPVADGSDAPPPHDRDHGDDHDHGEANGPEADHRHGSGMPHRFEDAEAWAKQFDSPERTAWQKPDDVITALKLPANAKVADIGAGTGYFSMRIARAVPQGHVYAGDIEPDMVRYLQQRAAKENLTNVTAVQGKLDDPALPETVDVVFLCNVYHHVSDREAYFAKVRDRIVKGGRLIIVDFKSDAPDDAPGPPRKHRVTQAQVEKELGAAGFRLQQANRDLLPYQYILEFELNPT